MALNGSKYSRLCIAMRRVSRSMRIERKKVESVARYSLGCLRNGYKMGGFLARMDLYKLHIEPALQHLTRKEMKIIAVIAALTALSTVQASVLAKAPAPMLEKRSCVTSGCRVPKGTPQGEYCGGGGGCPTSDVYECGPSGVCCNYGYRTSCAQCGALSC